MTCFIGRNLSVIISKWLRIYLNFLQEFNSYILIFCLVFIISNITGCKSLTYLTDKICNLSICQNLENKHDKPLRVELDKNWLFYPSNSASSNYYDEHSDFTKFKPIKVPSNWFSQGYEHSGVAWYKTTFNINNLHSSKKLYQLIFDGIDYFADVWVNGNYVGFHEGYFQSFRLNVSNYLHEGENLLVVKVNSPQEKAGQSWSLHKQYIKGVLGHHDTRPGGAWSERGQEKNTGGIWQSVWLETNVNYSIKKFKFTPNILSNGLTKADLEVSVLSKNNLSTTLEYSLYFKGELVEKYHKDVKLYKGNQLIKVKLPEKQRKLWSPWEHGKPHLYQLKIVLKNENTIYSEQKTKVGFREFSIEEPAGVWNINGKPLFVRGTNYIAWQWLSDVSEKQFLADLILMKEANINAIRVHAHVLPDRFYKLADELGMVIWQDFPLQWGYIDSPEFISNAQFQAKEMVEQFYNHPSILVWSAHNEPPWDASWMKYKYADYDKNQNLELDNKVFQTLKSLDQSRYSHKSSLTSEHPWFGWYSGEWTDYLKPTNQRWITEFGAQALPDKATLKKIVGKENLWPVNKEQWGIWEYHNFQPSQTFKIAKVEKGIDIESLINNSQQYQFALTALAAESYRRQKMAPVNAIFQFMFVENWASINWGIVDYLRQPKPAYYALQKAYQPLLPSIEYIPKQESLCCTINFSLWVVNDYPKSFESYKLKYQLFKNGLQVSEQIFESSIKPSSVKKVTDIKINDVGPGEYQINWIILDNKEKVVASNEHKWKVDDS